MSSAARISGRAGFPSASIAVSAAPTRARVEAAAKVQVGGGRPIRMQVVRSGKSLGIEHRGLGPREDRVAGLNRLLADLGAAAGLAQNDRIVRPAPQRFAAP